MPENRIKQIEVLVEGWSVETALFVLRQLRQFEPKHRIFDFLIGWVRANFCSEESAFQFLRNPERLGDWRRRIEVSGSHDAKATWNRILGRELTWHDYHYLRYLLEQQTIDIYVPDDFLAVFRKLYRAHVLKEFSDDPTVPRAPLLLVIGGSGSGKSATVGQALEEAVFAAEVRPIIDLQAKKRRSLPANRSGAVSRMSIRSWRCVSNAGARRNGCAFCPACRGSNSFSASGWRRPSRHWMKRGWRSITR